MAMWALCQFWWAMMMFLCCVVLLSSHIHCIGDEGFYAKRRGLLCQATMGFMPSVPNFGQSDGYHMHNIVVSHGVGYVYVWVVCRWVLINEYNDEFCDDLTWWNAYCKYDVMMFATMGFYAKKRRWDLANLWWFYLCCLCY